MTSENPDEETKNRDDTHLYRYEGYPPLPFSEEPETDRGETVYAVLDLGRQNEDVTVDRVFYDEKAAQHHRERIRSEVHIPARVIPVKLE